MRVLVTGGAGFLGTATVRAARAAGDEVVAAGRTPADGLDHAVDLAAPGTAAGLIEAARPDAVIHLAAVPDIAPCREDPDRAWRVNAEVPGEVAAACRRAGVRLVHVSTDQVFDGERPPWREDDAVDPRHHYGRTKASGEAAVTEADPGAAIVRPGLVTGPAPPGRRSATTGLVRALRRAARGEAPPPSMFTDEIRSPVCVEDVAAALVALAHSGEGGVFHCGGPEPLSRCELARREAVRLGFDAGLVGRGSRVAAGLAGERPADLTLVTERLVALTGWTPRTLGPLPEPREEGTPGGGWTP